jgi:tetratricopeptide (TPR) repeat protein
LVLGTLLVLAGCGESAPGEATATVPGDGGTAAPQAEGRTQLLFEEGNARYLRGAELLVSAGASSQAGDTETAQAEFEEAQVALEEAAARFQEVLALEPDHVSAMTNLAIVYYSLGRLDEAIAEYRRALEIAPEDADIHSNLAAAYVQMDEMDLALAQYQLAVELDPELAEAHFGLGVVHMQLGQNEAAMQSFERFQALDQGQDPIATEQAKLYLEQLRSQ